MKIKSTLLNCMIILALAAVAFLVLPTGSAQAESGAGRGILHANGDGVAGIRGNGEVEIAGNGILWVQDLAGDASIEVSGYGRRSEISGGWIRYAGFQGQATISGTRIAVVLSGIHIDLEATGAGVFFLRGSGTYRVEKGGQTILTGNWSEAGETISLP